MIFLSLIHISQRTATPGAAGAGHASGRGKCLRAGTGRAPRVAAAKHWRAVVHRSGAISRSCILCDSSAGVRAIVLHSSCTGWLPRSYRRLGPGHKAICRSWKVSMAPSSPRPGSTRARHDDPSDRPHDPPRPPLSQRSFLWPKRLTAGGAAAKEASSGAVGPGEALGTLVTISGYVKRPRYARLNTPMGAGGAIPCMPCASYSRPWVSRPF